MSKKYKTLEKELFNISGHINTLNKESIETNMIVKKTLDSWLERNGERIVKEYVRKFNPSLFMEMKFKDNEKRIKKLEEELITKENRIKERLCIIEDKDKPAKHKDGCYQFTYCNECLAYPMGYDCPNLTKGPVQLKDEVKH